MMSRRKKFYILGFNEKTRYGNDVGKFSLLQDLDNSCDFDNFYQGWLHRCYAYQGKVIVKDLLSNGTAKFSFPDEKLKVKDATVGWHHIYVVASDGSCWFSKLSGSDNATLQKVSPLANSPAKSVDSGDAKVVFLLENGLLFEILHQEDMATLVPVATSEPVRSVACGKEHVLLLTVSGTILSYGIGSRGQLGHGNVEATAEPTIIDALDGISIRQISSGGWHSAAISNDGDAYIWGWNESCQLGFPNKICEGVTKAEVVTIQAVPKLLDFLDDAVDICCGSRHTVALTNDDKLWSWGWNGYGQLGCFPDEFIRRATCVLLPDSMKSISEIRCKHWTTILSVYE